MRYKVKSTETLKAPLASYRDVQIRRESVFKTLLNATPEHLRLNIEKIKKRPADKPGSVVDNHSSGALITQRLVRSTQFQHGPCYMELYLILLQAGFAMPFLLPETRCALTTPFHPYPMLCLTKALGGLLSVALSVGLHPPGITWRSALWSPDFPHLKSVTLQSAIAWLTFGYRLTQHWEKI